MRFLMLIPIFFSLLLSASEVAPSSKCRATSVGFDPGYEYRFEWRIKRVSNNGDVLLDVLSRYRVWAGPVRADGSKRVFYTFFAKSSEEWGIGAPHFVDFEIDGSYSSNFSVDMLLGRPSHLFPGVGCGAQWQAYDPADEAPIEYRRISKEGSLLTFEGDVLNPTHPIFKRRDIGTYVVDLAKGHLERASIKYNLMKSEHWEFDIRFVEKVPVDSKWKATLTSEMSTYFEASLAYLKKYEEAIQDFSNFDAYMKTQKALLDRYKDHFKTSLVSQNWNVWINNFESLKKKKRTVAEYTASQTGMPSPLWTLESYNGKSVSLKDLKGKVVLLDFWTSSCHWCHRAFPKLDRLAHQYKDREDVVFLGMNNNTLIGTPEEIKKIIEAFQFPYNILNANSVYKQYHAFSYPLLVILDRDLNIRYRLTGYTPWMQSTVDWMIQRSLATAP